MTQPASQPALSKFSINAYVMEYQPPFGLVLKQDLLSTDGIRGVHDHPSERVRLGLRHVGGPIKVQPGKADLDALLPLITGSAKNGSHQFPLAETLSIPGAGGFSVIIDRVAAVFTYINCKVDTATFEAQSGSILDLTLGLEAFDETVAGSSPSNPSVAAPYVFMDGVFTLASTAYQIKQFKLTIDNHLKKDRFMNTTTRADLPFMDRTIRLECQVPYTSDELGIYGTGITAESVSLVFTNGTNVFTISSSGWQIEPMSPQVQSKEEEILLPLQGFLRTVSGSGILTLQNDPV